MIDNSELNDFIEQMKLMDSLSQDDINEIISSISKNELTEFDTRLIEEPVEEQVVEAKPEVVEKQTDNIRALIGTLKVGAKIKLALFGNSTVRGLLINDALRIIQIAVLKNPKIQENEIEAFCKNPNTSQNVFREVIRNKKWFKSQNIKLVLCYNPKCPPDISLKLLTYLHKSDVKEIGSSRNIPSALSLAARKLLEKMK